MDVLRALGIKIEGIGAYPYNSVETLKYASGIGASFKKTGQNGYGYQAINQAVGAMAAYSFRSVRGIPIIPMKTVLRPSE